MTCSARGRSDAALSRLSILALALLVLPTTARAFQTCTVERVSLAFDGAQAPAGTWTTPYAALSADGRYVAWSSNAGNLVPGDTNDGYDVFVRDRQSGTTERVSVDSFGSEASNWSGTYGLDMSADGNRIAFTSFAQLAPNDTNSSWDIYVHDRTTAQTVLVSVNTSGTAGNAHCFNPAISADGRCVAFLGRATDLVAQDTNGTEDTFVRDLVTGVTERVNVSSSGAQADDPWSSMLWDPTTPALSADGRFVVFACGAENLVPGDTNGTGAFPPEGQDVFLRDRLLSTTTRVSVATGGIQANSYSDGASISADGLRVAFRSYATNLAPGSAGGIFVHEIPSGVTTLVSQSTGGATASDGAERSTLSADGRYVIFSSFSAGLVAGDTNGRTDVFVRDLVTATTARLGSDSIQGDGPSYAADISHDGRVMAWASFATNLIGGDTNGVLDVFASACSPVPFAPFCSGTASACPCANGGDAFSGCDNSLATGGARLVATGSASLAADTLVLVGDAMTNSSALYIQGTTQHNGGAGTSFGDGLRCAGGSIVRIALRMNAGGASLYPSGAEPGVAQRGLVTAPGTRTYQVWYRNSAAFCTAAAFNLSNGIEVTWDP